jgi:flagellar basal-body rod protein FlgB
MAHDITLDAVRLALGMQQLRAEVASANIAHGTTPGHQPQRVDFAAANAWLHQAASGFAPAGAAPAATSAAVVADVSAAALQPDTQVAEMVTASLEFQALGESLNRHFGLMRLAITGRSV